VDVICAGSKGEKKIERRNGVDVHRVYFSYHRGNLFWYLLDYAAFFVLVSLKLAQLSLRKRFDVIEVQTMPDFIVFTTLFPRLLGSKVIFYMFENTPELFALYLKIGPNHILTRLMRFIARVSASYANRVIVSDGFVHKKDLQSIPDKKITTVLNVPDNAIFNAATTRTDGDGHHFNIIVVSTILRRYGVQTLIQAVPLLVKDIPELKIDVIGEGEHLPDLQQLACELGVEGYLNFTGFIPYEDIPGYIAKAHIGLAPMIEDVGAPNKIFEYFAFSKATIASAQPSFKALFDESCVSYFQPGNAEELAGRILELYHNPEKRMALGNCGQAFYHKYHWPVMKQRYLKVYQQLIAQN
jgi:glycosyltransferase involved in cell wall biosynthesis